MKTVLFCLATQEELVELQHCIKAVVHAGHAVYILHRFDSIPLLYLLGASPYDSELLPTPESPGTDQVHMLVVGHQSELGKQLVTKGDVPFKIMYQGKQPNAGDWPSLHEHLNLVWGKTREGMSDWKNEVHKPFIGGEWADVSFSKTCLRLLSDCRQAAKTNT